MTTAELLDELESRLAAIAAERKARGDIYEHYKPSSIAMQIEGPPFSWKRSIDELRHYALRECVVRHATSDPANSIDNNWLT